MADRLLLYVNSSGFYQEHADTADSIKFLSYKIGSYELTGTKLGHLIDGADATDEHIHDARYFTESEHIAEAIKASKVIQDLTFTADSWGIADISIEYTTGGTAGSEVVSVVGHAISVQIESGVSTATQVKAAIDGSTPAAALVDVVISGTGSNPQVAVAPTTLDVLGAGKPIKTNAAGVIDHSFIDPDVAGDALGWSSGAVKVNVDDSSIEINSDALRVKADGIKDSMIDWGTSSGQVSASDMPILDSAGYFAATDVEAALAELYTNIVQNGVFYTVGVGGVTKGDLVYVSANDTVLPLSTLTSAVRGIGLCLTTESAAGSVKVLANDVVLTGVLSSATAGATIYWTGSGFSETIPAGAAAYVWKVGVAKNATDLHVECEFIKRNA